MAKDRARLEAACKAREEERTAILERSKKQKRISFSTNKVAWDLLNACINTWDAKSCDEKMRWGEQRTHLNEFVLRAQDIGIRLSVRTMEPYLADVGVRKCLPPFGYTLRGKPRLLSKDDESAVIEIVAKSDEQNRGLTTGECIVLIEDMRPDLSTAQARVALKHAKKVGSKEGLLKTNMQGIQNTTKERTAISPRQQARWYYFVKYMWSLLEELNFARRGCMPTRDWHRCKPYAIWNYDEECIMACGHRVRIVGSRNVRKHELLQLARFSITVLKCGCAAGTWGPVIFLVKGTVKPVWATDEWLEKEGMPPGSTILMTPNAFMNNDAFTELTPLMLHGQRFAIAKDCPEYDPNWWIMNFGDGFLSHVLPLEVSCFVNLLYS
jgi:hypothetical protein